MMTTPPRRYRVAPQPKTRIATWLEEAMERRKLNQQALAGRSRVSQGNINAILLRGRIPTDDVIRRLARALEADETEALVHAWIDRVDKLLADAPNRVKGLFRATLRKN